MISESIWVITGQSHETEKLVTAINWRYLAEKETFEINKTKTHTWREMKGCRQIWLYMVEKNAF